MANSDDLTLASPTITDANKCKNNSGAYQNQSAVQKFRTTIARALQTHLEMTTSFCCDYSTAATKMCCKNSNSYHNKTDIATAAVMLIG